MTVTGGNLITLLESLCKEYTKIYGPGPDEVLIADNVAGWMNSNKLTATDVLELLTRYMKMFQLTCSITDFANALGTIWEKYRINKDSQDKFNKLVAATEERMKEVE